MTLAEQLSLRRNGIIPIEEPIGILTHHPALDEDAWRFLEELLEFLRWHEAVEFLQADRLFQPRRAVSTSLRPRASHGAAVQHASHVTVVITSCGRQDLLEVTLDSFLAHNSFPIRQ